MATTKPGDLVGQDSDGRVRIDRVIPLQWVLSILGAVVLQGMAGYYQLQQATEQLREMRSRLESFASAQSLQAVHDAEQASEIRELRRRIESLEAKRQ